MKNVEFLRIESLLESIGLKQMAVEPSPDSELGFRMWGGKDALGVVTRFLAKGKPGLLESLRVSSLASASAGPAMLSPTGELYKGTVVPVLAEPAKNCVFVSNNGDDDNDGLTPATTVQTMTKAIEIAHERVVGSGEVQTIVCRDNSEFGDDTPANSFNLTEGVGLYAPLATFKNSVVVTGPMNVVAYHIRARGSTALVLIPDNQTTWTTFVPQIIKVNRIYSDIGVGTTAGGCIGKHYGFCDTIVVADEIHLEKTIPAQMQTYAVLLTAQNVKLYLDASRIIVTVPDNEEAASDVTAIAMVASAQIMGNTKSITVRNASGTRVGRALMNVAPNGLYPSQIVVAAEEVHSAVGAYCPSGGTIAVTAQLFNPSTTSAFVTGSSEVFIEANRLSDALPTIVGEFTGKLRVGQTGSITVSDHDYTPATLYDKLDPGGGVETELVQASVVSQRIRLNATAGAAFRGEVRSTESAVLTSFGLNLAANTDISQSAILCHVRRIGVTESLVFTVEYQTTGDLPRVTILANDANYSFTSFVTDGFYGWLSLSVPVADADYLVSYSSLDLQQKSVLGYLDPNANGVVFTDELLFSSAPSKIVDLTAGGGSSTSGTHYTFTPQLTRPSSAPGTVYYRDLLKSWVGVDAAGDEFEFGREEKQRCINTLATAIPAGKAVYVHGFDSGFPVIRLARSNVKTTCILVGVTTTEIPGNYGVGEVLFRGFARGLDTSAFSDGDLIYISDSVAGTFTTIEPQYPSLSALMGRVGVASATEGTIFVLADTDPNQSTTGVPGLVFKEATMTASVYVAGKGSFSNADGTQFGTSFYANAGWKPTRVRFRQSQGAISANVRIGLYSEAGLLLAQSALFTGSGDLVLSQTLTSVLEDDLIPGSLYHAVICSKSNGHLVYGASPGNLNANPRMGFQGQIVMDASANCPADISSIIGSASPDRAWIEFF